MGTGHQCKTRYMALYMAGSHIFCIISIIYARVWLICCSMPRSSLYQLISIYYWENNGWYFTSYMYIFFGITLSWGSSPSSARASTLWRPSRVLSMMCTPRGPWKVTVRSTHSALSIDQFTSKVSVCQKIMGFSWNSYSIFPYIIWYIFPCSYPVLGVFAWYPFPRQEAALMELYKASMKLPEPCFPSIKISSTEWNQFDRTFGMAPCACWGRKSPWPSSTDRSQFPLRRRSLLPRHKVLRQRQKWRPKLRRSLSRQQRLLRSGRPVPTPKFVR